VELSNRFQILIYRNDSLVRKFFRCDFVKIIHGLMTFYLGAMLIPFFFLYIFLGKDIETNVLSCRVFVNSAISFWLVNA
jgi:hypothetical protein